MVGIIVTRGVSLEGLLLRNLTKHERGMKIVGCRGDFYTTIFMTLEC